MKSKHFWMFFVFALALIASCQPVGWAAYVAFYVPFILVCSWILFWYLQWVVGFSPENHAFQRVYAVSFKAFLTLLVLTGFFTVLLIVNSYLLKPKKNKFQGRIVSISKQYVPFFRRWSPMLLTIENSNGERTVMMPRFRYGSEFWVGEKVVYQKSSKGSIVSSNLQFDSLSWHFDLVKKWPTAKRSWQEVIHGLERNHGFEEMLKWVPLYAKNFTADEYLISIGNHYWLNQDLKKAVDFFHAAYTGAPNDYNVLKYYGFYLAKQGKKEEGIRNKAFIHRYTIAT